jgi:mono/diheme cytochrome c family protein
MIRTTFIRSFLRWSARIVLGLVALVALAVGTVYAFTEHRLARKYVVPTHGLTLPNDIQAIERGERLATIKGCNDCHGPSLQGTAMLDDPAFGRLSAPNIGPGGRGAVMEPLDWELAVRHGLRRDGTALLIMPAHEFQTLTDEDLGSIVLWARSLAATKNRWPAQRVGPVARLAYAVGKLHLVSAELVKHDEPHLARLEPAITKEYGAYVTAGCIGCHGANYSGGPIPGAPPGWKAPKNITPDPATGIGTWTEEQFLVALRTGLRPDGKMIDTSAMPVRMTMKMTEVELRAAFEFLHSLPPRPYGGR